MDLLSLGVLVTSSDGQEVAPHRYRTGIGERGIGNDRPIPTSLNELRKRDGINGTILANPATSATGEKVPESDGAVPSGVVKVGGGLKGVGWRRERTQRLPLSEIFTV